MQAKHEYTQGMWYTFPESRGPVKKVDEIFDRIHGHKYISSIIRGDTY